MISSKHRLPVWAALVPLCAALGCAPSPSPNEESTVGTDSLTLPPITLPPPGPTNDPIVAACQSPVSFYDHGNGSRPGPVTLIPIFWGPNATLSSNINTFYHQLESSLYYGWIRDEYNAPALNDYGVQQFDANMSGTVKESDIKDRLEHLIETNEIPYADNPLYIVHMPAGTTVLKDDGTMQCKDFLAFNGWKTKFSLSHWYTYDFVVMPDLAVCGDGSLATATRVESHEIIENVTDYHDGGWRDTTQPAACGNQIGDLCANIADTIRTPYGTATIQKMWSNRARACVTEDFVVPTPPPAGAHLAAYEQNDGQVDALVISNDGNANLAWEARNGAWVSFATLAARIAPPGAPVVIDRQNGTQLDAFVVGYDGAVYVLWENNNGPWAGPVRITAPGLLRQGAHIATAHQNGPGQLDIFYVDTQGRPTVQWVNGFGAWSNPAPLQGPGAAPSGAPLATGYQGSNQLDLFWVDNGGTVRVMAVVGGGAWAGPWAISRGGVAPAGAPLATAPQGGNQLDLFFVDVWGNLEVAWVVGTGAWGGPVGISGGGLAGSGAYVAAGQQGPNQTDVFYIDRNGQAQVQWVVGTGAWSGPAAISQAKAAPPGAPIVVVEQNANQLDALFVGYNGLDVTWESSGSRWAAPVQVFPPAFQ
jgi:hypothetical protein